MKNTSAFYTDQVNGTGRPGRNKPHGYFQCSLLYCYKNFIFLPAEGPLMFNRFLLYILHVFNSLNMTIWTFTINGMFTTIYTSLCTPRPLRAVGVLFSPMVSRWVGGRWEKVCLACISETVRCRKLILGRDIGVGLHCRGVTLI